MPRRVGWLALVLAVSGSGFLWVAISRANVFCGGGPDECPSLIGEAPRYIAVFGMLVPAIAISVVLDRHRLVPRLLSVSAIVLSALALAAALAMTVAAYDYMLTSIGSGRLDLPDRPLLVPAEIRGMGGLWPLFIGGWITLTSLQLVRLDVPIASSTRPTSSHRASLRNCGRVSKPSRRAPASGKPPMVSSRWS